MTGGTKTYKGMGTLSIRRKLPDGRYANKISPTEYRTENGETWVRTSGGMVLKRRGDESDK